MSFRIRNFDDRDILFLVQILNTRRKGSYEFTPLTEEGLKSWMAEGKLRILMAENNSEILGTGAYHDGYWGEEIEWLLVSRNTNQVTVENALLSELEKLVKGKQVFTVADAGSPEIEEWTQRGYSVEGGLLHMIAKLDGAKPIPQVADGIVLRSLKPEEEKALIEATNTGFGWERLTSGALEKWKKESPPFSEEWVCVAEHENRIVSVVVAKPDTRYNQNFQGKRGYLGPATTLPEYRGKNLATALTRMAMNVLFENGMDSAALYTQEQNLPSVALLKKLDFEVGHHWRFMRKHFES